MKVTLLWTWTVLLWNDLLQSSAVEFARVFNASISSKTVSMDCQYLNSDICCSALQDQSDKHGTNHGVPTEKLTRIQQTGSCITTKEYVPSPYEIRHLLKAKQISRIPSHEERLHAILDFITHPEEMRAAQKWLERVKVRMQSNARYKKKTGRKNVISQFLKGYRERDNPEDNPGDKEGASGSFDTTSSTGAFNRVHPDDREYMSKFIVNKTCSGNGRSRAPSTIHWVEWIEPLSVHARHPFGECVNLVEFVFEIIHFYPI